MDGIQPVDRSSDVTENGRARDVLQPLQIAYGAPEHAVHEEEDAAHDKQSSQEPRVHQHHEQDRYADGQHVLEKLFHVAHQPAVGCVVQSNQIKSIHHGLESNQCFTFIKVSREEIEDTTDGRRFEVPRRAVEHFGKQSIVQQTRCAQSRLFFKTKFE